MLPAPKPASVCIRDLARRYGAIDALRGVSLDVRPGEVFGLLGPNGAGKTTALECLLGLRRADSGSISIAGVDVLANPGEARQWVGALIQGAVLQDKITPSQVLGLFGSFYSRPADVDGLIATFGLSEKRDAPFDSLSAGQRQRLFLALALVNNPSLVVLDEPTGGLDPLSRRQLHDLIRGMRAQGRTVILSTHDLDEAQGLCDTVAILDNGRVVAMDSPAGLVAKAGSSAKVKFRTSRAVSAASMERLPGVEACLQTGDAWELRSRNVSGTVVGLVQALESEGNALRDLQVQAPSLEEAFLSLTGRKWTEPGEGRA